MQRTFILHGQDTNTLISSPSSSGPFYGPFGGVQPDNALQTTTIGNGCYSTAAFSGVLSHMYVFIGYVNAAISTTSQVNVGGSPSPAGGNLKIVTPSTVQNTNSYYYYDATHIDAIVSGQNTGLQISTDRSGSGQVSLSHINIACDSPNNGWHSPIVWSAGAGAIYNNSRHYCGIMGQATNGAFPASGAPAAAQNYSAQSFVASHLQWQTATGNADTSAATTCTFSVGSAWGSTTNTSMSAVVQGASYVGQQTDLTHVAAVPAASYLSFNWTGSTSGNTLKAPNAGVHVQPTNSNATWLLSGGPANNWPDTINPCYTPFSGTRWDSGNESGCPAPTAGVFSNLAVQIEAFSTATTFNLQTTSLADTGSGVGGPVGSYNYTAIMVSFTGTPAAPCWQYDLTDIAAVTAGECILLAATATVATGVAIQCQSIDFTAPAHLGLTTMGAG